MEEIWRDIKDYEGKYQISSLGNVRSFTKWKNGELLKQKIDPHGYHCVNLYKDKKRKTFKIHKLVAMNFLNHIPNGFNEVVDHINNNKSDNRLCNLQLTTHRHNSSKDKKGCSSKYTGVSFSKGRGKDWRAFIMIDGKIKSLGSFDCELAAAKAYQDKLKQINK